LNRYDLLLGKKAPPEPECNNLIIFGGRGSGKTTVLLHLLRLSIESGVIPLLSVIGGQVKSIRNELGPLYSRRCKIIYGFDESYIRGVSHLFLDNVEIYLDKLRYIHFTQNITATCDKNVFLAHFQMKQIPRKKICVFYGQRWKLEKVEEIRSFKE